jgi:hypothetical protein
MLVLIRHRYPRAANILGFVTGVITLAIGIACGAEFAARLAPLLP